MEKTCLDFYRNLYQHKEVSECALREILEDLPNTFTASMNESLSHEITEKELSSAILSMTKGKTHGHNGIPIEFFQYFWPTIGLNFYQILRRGVEDWALHEGVTKGLISLISKDGDSIDLKYWRPIILLTSSYKVIVKTLQLGLPPILRDVIGLEPMAFSHLGLSWTIFF